MSIFNIVMTIMISGCLIVMLYALTTLVIAELQDRYWSKRLGCNVILGQVFCGDHNRTANAYQRLMRQKRRTKALKDIK